MNIHRVEDWMSKPAIVAAPSASLADALRLMQERRIRRLPVVDRDRLVGIITRGDLRAAQPEDGARLDFKEWRALLDQTMVQEYMTSNPLTTAPGASMMEVAHTLLANKISGMPVVEEGRVVGVISETDLLYLLIADEVRLEELGPGETVTAQ
jgi:CBS domain-containing protein